MPQEDQRLYPRIAFREAVQYRFPDKPLIAGALGYDLSVGGLRFTCEEYFPLGANIIIHVTMSADRVAALLARVVWTQKVPHSESYHVGCEFSRNRENIFSRLLVENYVELFSNQVIE